MFALQIIFANELNGSSVDMALLMTVCMLPGLLFGLFAGVLVDRFKKKPLLVLTGVLSGCETVFVIYVHAIAPILVLIFIRGCLGALNSPAQQAVIKFITENQRLMQVSALVTVSVQISRVIGPFIGAFLLVYFHPRICLWLNAASFFLSAALVVLIAFSEQVSSKIKETPSFFRALRQTFCVLFELKQLMLLMGYALIALLLVMMTESQMALLLKHYFPNIHAMLGHVMAMSAFGSVLSGGYLAKKGSPHELRLLVTSFFVLAFVCLINRFFSGRVVCRVVLSCCSVAGFGLRHNFGAV